MADLKRQLIAMGMAKSLITIVIMAIVLSHVASLAIAWFTDDLSGYFDHSVYMATAVPLLVAPPSAWLVLHLVFELEENRAELEKLSQTDGLTEIFNRRHFLYLGEIEIKKAERHGLPLSIAVFDLDHFKQVNDQLGHDAGDAVLQQVVTRCAACLREEDVLGRMGGEEFAILMPFTDISQAGVVAERVRSEVVSRPIVGIDFEIRITICIGLADRDAGGDLHTLLKAADRRLYHAKHMGRDRIVFSG